MSDQVEDPEAAGWKPDPSGRFAGRFWNGTGWTAHVVDRDLVTSTDPVPYPPPQPQRPLDERSRSAGQTLQRLPRWARVALPLVVLVVIVVAMSLGGDHDDSTPPVATDDTATPAPPTKSIYTVGETARTGGFDVTLFGSRDPQTPGAFLKPAEGKHLVAVDVSVTNRTRAVRSFSSLLGFHLVDTENRHYDASFGELTPEAPDGDIAPDEARRGFVVFEVPDSATGLRLQALGDLTATEVLFALR